MTFDFSSSKLPSKVLLQTPALINKRSEKVFVDLLAQYAAIDSVWSKVACTIACAILTQQRAYFALTRRVLQDIVMQDPNHCLKSGFSNGQYKELIFHLTETFELIELVNEGTRNTAMGFKAVHPDLVSYLSSIQVDNDSQLAEMNEFCNARNK